MSGPVDSPPPHASVWIFVAIVALGLVNAALSTIGAIALGSWIAGAPRATVVECLP